jgi:phosphate transport system substrate-binding protein
MKLRSMLALLMVFTMSLGLGALAADFDQTQTIAVVSREEGSGTRGAFIELTGIATKDAAGVEIDNTYAEADFVNGQSLVMTTVAANDYAIGYASLAAVQGNDTIKALKVNGVEATTENILNSTYALARPFNVITIDAMQDPIALDFLAFIMSKEGQEVVAGNKLVTACP